MIKSADQIFEDIVKVYVGNPKISQVKMFGSPGLKVNNKVFTFLWKGELVLKLPKEKVDILVNQGSGKLFDPGHGKTSKEWVAIKPLNKEEWLELAQEAKEFVASL